MSDKKLFKPLDEDLDDVAERVAAAKNIPTLTRPVAAPKEDRRPPSTVRKAAHAAPIPPTPSPSVATPTRSEPGRKQRGVTEIRIRCPQDVADQLVFEQQRLRREGQRVTLNYLVLSALRTAGYKVDELDLVEDGRRLR